MGEELKRLWKTEDYWAVWLGLGIVALALTVFWAGSSIKSWAVTPGSLSGLGTLASGFADAAGFAMVTELSDVVESGSIGDPNRIVDTIQRASHVRSEAVLDVYHRRHVSTFPWGICCLRLFFRDTGPTSTR